MDMAYMVIVTDLLAFGAGGHQQQCLLRIKRDSNNKMAYLGIFNPQTMRHYLANRMPSYAIMGQSSSIIMTLLTIEEAIREETKSI